MKFGLLSKQTLTRGEVFADELAARYGGTLPKLLAYYPVAQMNPFQSTLYGASKDAGYMILPAFALHDVDTIRWKGRSIIHLHWLTQILRGVDDFHEGTKKIYAFIEMLDRWQQHGYKIVWTMHNVLPHNAANVKLESYLREKLVQKVDAIHIMNRNSIDIASKYYAVPEEKKFFVPHPSFAEWYPNVINKENSRAELHLRQDNFYFLHIGSISPYKKIEDLIEAFIILSRSRPNALLLIAGFPSDKRYTSKIIDISMRSNAIAVHPIRLAETQFQLYMNACDIVVLPYETLNSGIAVLAYDFKKYCIGPSNSGVASVFSHDYELLYEHEQPDGLLKMMQKATSYDLSLITYPKMQDIESIAVSKKFFDILDSIIMYLH